MSPQRNKYLMWVGCILVLLLVVGLIVFFVMKDKDDDKSKSNNALTTTQSRRNGGRRQVLGKQASSALLSNVHGKNMNAVKESFITNCGEQTIPLINQMAVMTGTVRLPYSGTSGCPC